MIKGSTADHWYVVYSRPKEELRAFENLEHLGYEAFLPMARSFKRRAGGSVEVIEPLFPRYLFVSLLRGVDDFARIRSTRGCVGLVKFGLEPAKLEAVFIDRLKNYLSGFEGGVVDLLPKAHSLKPGQKVLLAEGQFAGLLGEVCALKANQRVVVLLDILGGKRKVEVNVNDLGL